MTSALNVLSGIAAAAAGLSGEKVSKSGTVPGLDLAEILPALLGKTGGTGGSLLGSLASAALKSGLLNNSNLAELAGSLLSHSSGKAEEAKKAATGSGGIAGLAAAVAGNSGSGSDMGSIAEMAAKLALNSGVDGKGTAGIASELGKTLSSSFGVSLNGAGTALKALDKLPSGTKSDLFKAILKGLG